MRYAAALLSFALTATCLAQQPTSPHKVLIFYTLAGEADHVLFATSALQFFAEQADRQDFRVDATTNWADLNEENLKQYRLVVWLNTMPPAAQQPVFQRYMETGGGWLGFHVSAYNDRNSRWPWFREFLGGAIFGVNNWPPLPARLITDDTESPITHGLPKTWLSPVNEWYSWRPSPRLDKNVRVLLSLDPTQNPLGIKSMINDKDVPVVWTNTNFRMLYMNMGHGDKVFISPLQNKLFENAILSLLK